MSSTQVHLKDTQELLKGKEEPWGIKCLFYVCSGNYHPSYGPSEMGHFLISSVKPRLCLV